MSPLLFALNALAQDPDPRLWLEEVDGEEALAWVKERNAEKQRKADIRAERRRRIGLIPLRFDFDERWGRTVLAQQARRRGIAFMVDRAGKKVCLASATIT